MVYAKVHARLNLHNCGLHNLMRPCTTLQFSLSIMDQMRGA